VKNAICSGRIDMRPVMVGAILVLAVSASVTPANARDGIVKFQCNGNIGDCRGKCETELWYAAKLWDGARNPPESCPPLLQACMTTRVKAKGASRH
jgi:hypothetical protein